MAAARWSYQTGGRWDFLEACLRAREKECSKDMSLSSNEWSWISSDTSWCGQFSLHLLCCMSQAACRWTIEGTGLEVTRRIRGWKGPEDQGPEQTSDNGDGPWGPGHREELSALGGINKGQWKHSGFPVFTSYWNWGITTTGATPWSKLKRQVGVWRSCTLVMTRPTLWVHRREGKIKGPWLYLNINSKSHINT